MTRDGAKQMKDRARTDLLRLLRVLQLERKALEVSQAGEGFVTIKSRRGEFRFFGAVVKQGVRRGLLRALEGKLVILPAGSALLSRGDTGDFAAQHVRAERATVELPDGSIADVRVNANESPLARLYLRKGRSGRGYIGHSQFRAGERLRSDFEKANLRARMSVDWDREFCGGRAKGAAGGDISDMAVDARRRLHGALDCLEESLRGVVLDVCCFLKGLEDVERDRQWPPRSAKLMLRTALSILAGHYGIDASARSSRPAIRQWGDGDHRPSLF